MTVRHALVLEYSAMAEESNEDEGHNSSPIQVESRPPQTIPDAPPIAAAAETNVRDDSESSSVAVNDGEGKPLGGAPEKAAVSSSGTSSGSSGDSSSYLVDNADPVEVAKALRASGAKLIGGQVVGSLRFESCDREREFLAEAGGSFYLSLMLKRLMNTGAANALQCVEDPTLKSFVAARCARRRLEA
jgi:hypothetical protein